MDTFEYRHTVLVES